MNYGFGITPWGDPILPTYDPMSDPRRYDLYLIPSVVRFLRQFKPGAALNTEPGFVTVVRAGMYDGLGTLLPLGVYWYERVLSSTYQAWSMASCFDMIPFDRLQNWHEDDELREYARILQVTRFQDAMNAFYDYLQMRADPSYSSSYSLPTYMIDGDGLIVEIKPDAPFLPRFSGWWEPSDLAAPVADDEFDI